jgi:ADP-ribose pyrophosphatase YjhB (NUDIX family)
MNLMSAKVMHFKFCPHCAQPLQPMDKDGKIRPYCPRCLQIFYRNPTVGVAVVLMRADCILLVRRNGSYAGMWCIPCGHVEWNEDIRLAGVREFKEETGLDVTLGPVIDAHSNFHDPAKQTVGVWFWSECTGGRLQPGTDAQEARFFPLKALPEEMAFPTDRFVCEKIDAYMSFGRLKAWLKACSAEPDMPLSE